MEDWKKKTLFLGGLLGLIGGVICAQIMIKNADENEQQVHLDVRQGAKLGMAVYQAVKNLS